jgi:anti-sigma-K factor RskA
LHRLGLQRVKQEIAQWSALNLWSLPGTGHAASMIVENRSTSIGKAKPVEIRTMIGPERPHEASRFQGG